MDAFYGLGVLIQVESAAKTFHSTFCIHDSLFATEERVATAADFHSHLSLSGSSGEGVSTGADDLSVGMVFRMDIGFHCTEPH